PSLAANRAWADGIRSRMVASTLGDDTVAANTLSTAAEVSERIAAGVATGGAERAPGLRSEEHTSELQSRENLVCRLLHEKKNPFQQYLWFDRGLQDYRLSHPHTSPLDKYPRTGNLHAHRTQNQDTSHQHIRTRHHSKQHY